MGLEETGSGACSFVAFMSCDSLLPCVDENPDFSKSPRGIRYASLEGGKFSHWRVQGKMGGFLGSVACPFDTVTW